MTTVGPRISRRRFLQAVGAAGGAAAVLGSMEALRLVAPAGEHTQPFRPPRKSDFTLQGRANGTRVLILGAGIAGLATAYELEKAGYACEILEARERPGGRNWTVRGGTTETEIDGDGPDRRLRRGPVLQCRPGPHPAAPHDARLLPRARRPDRDLRQRQRRRVVLQRGGQRGDRVDDRPPHPAPDGEGRLPGLRQRTARQGDQPAGARRRPDRRRRRAHGRIPARSGGARPERRVRRRRSAWVHRAARRRAAGRGIGSAAAPRRRADQPARLLLPVRARVGPGDADVPAGRRHGPPAARPGRCDQGPHPLRRRGRGHRQHAGRGRGHLQGGRRRPTGHRGLLRLHHPADDPRRRSRTTSRPPCRRTWRPCVPCRPARSVSSSSAGSGRKTTGSSVASRTRTWTSARSGIRRRAISARRGVDRRLLQLLQRRRCLRRDDAEGSRGPRDRAGPESARRRLRERVPVVVLGVVAADPPQRGRVGRVGRTDRARSGRRMAGCWRRRVACTSPAIT